MYVDRMPIVCCIKFFSPRQCLFENLVHMCAYVTYPWIYVVTYSNGFTSSDSYNIFFVPMLEYNIIYLHLQPTTEQDWCFHVMVH